MPKCRVTESLTLQEKQFCPVTCSVSVDLDVGVDALAPMKAQLADVVESYLLCVRVESGDVSELSKPWERHDAAWGVKDFEVTVSRTTQPRQYEPYTTSLTAVTSCRLSGLMARVAGMFAKLDRVVEIRGAG